MKYTMTEVNVLTGEEATRPMTDAEIAQIEADAAEVAQKQTAEATKADAKAALLKKLGITAEEAALLLA